MRDAAAHLAKARESIVVGRYTLAGGFTDQAGRSAYMAGFHAALAIVVARSGKEPKTHNGVHAEFARLARADPNIGQDLVTFLSRAYGLKSFADYDDGNPVTRSEAQASLDLAEQFVDRIAAML